MSRKVILLGTICCALGLALLGFQQQATKDESIKKAIVATTFPIYQITRNVVKDRDGVSVELLLPSQLGCPHDYALTPQDMQKLAKGHVLVVNGLGLEKFLGAPVSNANSNLIIIDSSEGIGETLQYAEGESCSACKTCEQAGADTNPHLFVSPRMVAKLAVNIATKLSKADPEGEGVYTENSQAYAKKMNKLADEIEALGKRLRNNRIVPTHGIFDYLARDIGLEIVAVMQPHGQEPSAAEMMALVKTIREAKTGGIFYEPQYPEKTGLVLAEETGVKVGMLDPIASGPDNARLDYYETAMRKNMKALEEILGVK